MCVSDRVRCLIEKVVPHGAASIVRCSGLDEVTASAAVVTDNDDDDVICLDDDPPVKPQNQSQQSPGSVPYRRCYYGK